MRGGEVYGLMCEGLRGGLQYGECERLWDSIMKFMPFWVRLAAFVALQSASQEALCRRCTPALNCVGLSPDAGVLSRAMYTRTEDRKCVQINLTDVVGVLESFHQCVILVKDTVGRLNSGCAGHVRCVLCGGVEVV